MRANFPLAHRASKFPTTMDVKKRRKNDGNENDVRIIVIANWRKNNNFHFLYFLNSGLLSAVKES